MGPWVTRGLGDAGHDVVATDRRAHDGIVPCELADSPTVASLCRGVDAIVHLASSLPPESSRPRLTNTLAENLRATTNLVRACRANGVKRFIYASSIQVVAADDAPHLEVAYLPLDGNSPPNPRNAYGVAKLAEETLLQEILVPGCDVVCLRFPSLFRPVAGMLAGTRLLPFSEQERPGHLGGGLTCLSFPDAARLIAACLRADLPGFRVYLPAVSIVAPVSVPEYLTRYYSGVELRAPVDQLSSLVDLSVIEAETGWRPGDLPATDSPGDRGAPRLGT